MILSPIDYVIIALYFIVMIAVGFIAMRFTKTQEDYLVAVLGGYLFLVLWLYGRISSRRRVNYCVAPSWDTNLDSEASGST